jgi:hypothetical protein
MGTRNTIRHLGEARIVEAWGDVVKFIKCKIRNQDKYKWVAVDDEDFDYLNQWKWFEDKDGYAVRANIDRNTKKKLTAMPMHRLLMNPPKGMVVDHIDRSKTNNQRSNLRICTPEQNRYNMAPRNKLGLKGIKETKEGWSVRIRSNGEYIDLGVFDSVVMAVYAYNHAVDKYQGEYGYKNEIEKTLAGTSA